MYKYNQKQNGLSLLELLIALAIGSLLMIGLVSSFSNSNAIKRNLEQSGRLIENGQYAISVLTDNIRHAGFYGVYLSLQAAPAALPDPCNIGTTNTDSLTAGITVPLQGYTAADLTSRPVLTTTSCAGTAIAPDAAKNLLTNANLQPGSDILVIRRADSNELNGDPIENEIYMMSNTSGAEIQIGDNASGTVNWQNSTNSDGTGRNANTLKRYPNVTSATTDYAQTRKYHVHIYFVAPCSFGSATSGNVSGVCQNGDDDIPTLKRLELTSVDTDNNVDPDTTVMNIFPLVEGIEYMKFQYGVDNTPTAMSFATGYVGDGIPDTYVATPATVTDWVNVVSVRASLLVRSAERTPGYVDNKTYSLNGVAVGAPGDNFKRHVFNSEIRLNNMAGRREIPE